MDYGLRRIGLGIARGPLAEPWRVVANDPKDQLKAWEELVKLFQKENIQMLVVGLSENEMAEKTTEFVAVLSRKLKFAGMDIPVEYIDETLSSQAMAARLRTGGMKQSRRSGAIDHFVAAGLLQEWLDENL
jgi:RNase H-fold protein (predicted Holliday junction resolvase)